MKQNVGDMDRIIRFALGALLIAIGYFQMMWWLVIVGVVVVLTGVFRRCGAYALFGVSTCKVEPGMNKTKTL